MLGTGVDVEDFVGGALDIELTSLMAEDGDLDVVLRNFASEACVEDDGDPLFNHAPSASIWAHSSR